MLVVPSTRAAIAAVHHPPEALPAIRARAGLLARAYDELLPGGCRPVLRESAPGVTLVVLSEDGVPAPGELLWGAAAGADGPPDAAGVRRALARPAETASWRGVWVIAGDRDGGLRLVTTSTPVHTLVHAAHDGVTVLATRGLAALLLAGRAPKVAAGRIAEQVLFDYVMCDDELLEGTRVLHEATVADLHPQRGVLVEGWRERPLGRRTATGDDPAALRRLAADEAAIAVRHPSARYGLTGGRDSTLVAASARDAGIRMPSFTLGGPELFDSRGSALVARELGLELEFAAVAPDPGSLAFTDLVRWAAWQEGMENARTVGVGNLLWERRGVVWLSGHGGEICRAFYWKGGPELPDLNAAADHMVGDQAAMEPAAVATLRARLLSVLDGFSRHARSPEDALDLHYVWSRLFAWTARLQPYAQIDGVIPVLLSPEAIALMLGFSVEGRRDGRVFDAALALDGRDLHPRALAASRAALPGHPPRWRRALRRLRGGPSGAADWALLSAVRTGHSEEESIVRETLGVDWWRRLWERAVWSEGAQRQLWNALGVDAMHRRGESLRRELEGLA